jgi:hypothetical protein
MIMKMKRSALVLSFLIHAIATAQAPESVATATFIGYAEIIPDTIVQLMIGKSWKPECPVPLEDLRYLTLTHWGFDDEVHLGHLVVHKDIADDIVDIFAELFAHKFPIERMEIIDTYDADDELSMADNNTSAFCFRANTTKPGVYSNHSYGIAIDINPLVNPYIRGDIVLPRNARLYCDRTRSYKGMVTDAPDNICYRAFTQQGYEWGGHWKDRQDYQHFSKIR